VSAVTGGRVLLDASALLAWIFDERGADVVERLVPYSVISSVNFAEVARFCETRGYRRTTAQLGEDLEALGLRIEESITTADAIRAGELIHLSHKEKARHRGRTLALGDGMCLAVSERLGLPAVTGDLLWFDLAHLLRVQPRAFR
jgi:PIN domain nuclease of toxin-antitoxin system